MVEPLRVSSTSCITPDYMAGLYVVGKSNAIDIDIPHLPYIKKAELGGIDTKSVILNVGSDAIHGEVDQFDLLDTFCDGDVVWLDSKKGKALAILTERSNSNTLLLTEQCENRCLFCSQPPNTLEDTELYIKATLALLNYNSSGYVGLSGGEPTYRRPLP